MRGDDNPKATWGKYRREVRRLIMPFSLQVHHSLMDGLHVGRYFEALQERLNALCI